MKNYDKISIYKESNNNVQLRMKSTFFIPNEYYIIMVDHEKIVFRRPTIDYNGKLYKMSTQKGRTDVHTSVKYDLPLIKDIPFDEEESDEDTKVVYYR